MTKRLVSLFAFWAILTPAIAAEDWPYWRGPRTDGISTEKNLPLRWSADSNIAWKTPIPGIGHSSPIVYGDRVFVTTCLTDKEERVLMCLDRRNGKVLWQRVVLSTPLERKHRLNSHASSTPATDGKHVWVTFYNAPKIEVVCYDMDGDEVWRKIPGTFNSKHGYCSSVTLYKNTVIINADQDAKGFIVALDKATGKEMWRSWRPNFTRSYCAPLIIDADGKKQMVLSGSKCVAAYDPDNGKLIWIIDGPTEQYVASLVYTEGVLFLTAGFPTYHNMGILPGGKGNVTKSHILWHEDRTVARKASYVPSPIAHDKWFFMISDLGFLSCFEAKTGKRLWMEKLGAHHSASPILADGHIYFVDDAGITHIIKASPTFEVVSRNELNEKCRASPAVSQGQIFIRGWDHLYCIGKK